MLQQAINDYTLPSNQIKVDGFVGPNTIKASWKINPEDLTRAFLAKSRARYKDIVSRIPSDQKFFDGWINRISAIENSFGLIS